MSEAVDGAVQVLVDDEPAATWTGDRIRASGELAACTALLPALISDDRVLEIDGGITEQLAHGLETLQDIFCQWLPGATRVEVVAEKQAAPSGAQTVVFFSGGVDSFHAALKHRNEIDQLVYVEGFDVAASKPNLRTHVCETLTEASRLLEIPLTILGTDIRPWSDTRLPWGFYHGAALASAAHLLAAEAGRAIIPSSYAYAELFPWGSHPLTDPLWSGATTIVHSGSEASRPQKVATLVNEPAARKALRVCWKNPGEAYNCGVCEKCLRTMTSIAVYGVLDQFETFPDTLTAENVSKLSLTSTTATRFAETSVAMLKEQGVRPDLQRAWALALRGGPLRARARRQLRSLKGYASRKFSSVSSQVREP